ncbi:hypothetical protein BHM03_00049337 [Ensete ventricosum]|nr:hypothetical protein BHM03_00049337 [Ensete ventricosum]
MSSTQFDAPFIVVMPLVVMVGELSVPILGRFTLVIHADASFAIGLGRTLTRSMVSLSKDVIENSCSRSSNVPFEVIWARKAVTLERRMCRSRSYGPGR